MLYNSTQTSVIVYKYHKQTTVQYFGGEECSRSTSVIFIFKKRRQKMYIEGNNHSNVIGIKIVFHFTLGEPS